jgi:uncharacterized protein (TIGR03067 family)
MQRITCVLVVLATALLVDAGTDDVRKELKALQGKWKTVGIEVAGKPIPKDAIPEFSVVIGADGKSTGKMPKEEFQFTISVDPKKNPKTIDIEHVSGVEKGKKQYGVYKLEGDKWTVNATPPGSDEGKRPKDLNTKDSANVVFIFERVKEAKKP